MARTTASNTVYGGSNPSARAATNASEDYTKMVFATFVVANLRM